MSDLAQSNRPLPKQAQRANEEALWRRVLAPLASLRLTVTLFALAMFLIFAGTLAQRFEGNWTVVNEYFRPWDWPPTKYLVWIPFQIFAPEQFRIPGTFPFPGGFLIGGLLLVNLLAAHALRFSLSWKRAGILIIHAGLIVLLVGEAVTAVAQDEAQMTIYEGSYSHFAEDIRHSELAVIDPTDARLDTVVIFPQNVLRRGVGGPTLAHPLLPFSMRVDRWMDNSTLVGLGMADAALRKANPATEGFGTAALATPLPNVTGVDTNMPVDAPSAYITLLDDQGLTMGTLLVSLNLNETQEITIDGRPWRFALRFKRDYKPYTMHLLEFTHEKFVGTEKARNFASRIRLVDPTHNEDREVLIYMNHPLRYAGETFYQSAFKQGDVGTILQVVRNPGWLLPYISCLLVSLGLTVHFGYMLARFVEKSRS